ncbi:MAG TPA: DEAD/DEAH box helicase family protein [Candidatus Angelobacter sp.]|nr:DEAD/DEAH box helicase family protein [Candidatus Angelobacter sp.]
MDFGSVEESPLNEADTRSKLIDPAIHARGWTEDLIRREETAGAIQMIGGRPRRQARGRIDYTLRVKATSESQPVAVAIIEAKAESLPPNHGLEQAKAYAACKRLNVPFVFASNGHLFVEFDRTTGLTSSPRPISQFPSPADLRVRYEQHLGFSLSDAAAKPLLARYTGGEATRRYYQDAAIRAVLEKIALCERTGQPKRALLSLATGAGKTFIAVNVLRRIADARQLRRALFICDRDELRSQAAGALQNSFGADAATATSRNSQKNARVVIATYQTLDVDNEEGTASFLVQNYPVDYFSHIIIDECHRSAWGKWSEILTRNPSAVQIGLTATPRQLNLTEQSKEAEADVKITADNIRHFGEPVYEYDMAQGIEDGYLALCEIQKARVNIDETGITLADVMARNPIDANTGQPVTAEELRAFYEKTSYEDRILLPDRVMAMSQDLFNYLLASGGPEQKTIIFCARDRHADDVATELNNLYARWCAQQGKPHLEPYAFKCTASVGGSEYLADLRGASRSHFIATTVDLLSTGVDVPVVRNIVFFKYVRSPMAFYQMVGRGTRLDPPTGKLMFHVYDYTNATRLFGEDFRTRLIVRTEKERDEGPPKPPERTILVEGFEVHVTDAGRSIVTSVNGRAMPVTVEEYKQILAKRLVEEAATLNEFCFRWIEPSRRHEMLGHLPDAGRSPLVVQQLEEMQNYDLYDVLAELGYGANPRTRIQRAEAFIYKNADWLNRMPELAANTLKAISSQFRTGGTEALESRYIFQTPEVSKAGGLRALGLLGTPSEVLSETKERMFAP